MSATEDENCHSRKRRKQAMDRDKVMITKKVGEICRSWRAGRMSRKMSGGNGDN